MWSCIGGNSGVVRICKRYGLMSRKEKRYRIPERLDEPTRIVGMTMDEFIPSVGLFSYFFFSGEQLTAIVTFLISIVGLKLLKRGKGGGWLMNLCYWYMPKDISKSFIKHTPASQSREYIA